MAKSVEPFTWKNGFRQPAKGTPWIPEREDVIGEEHEAHYVVPPSVEQLTSTVHNALGLNSLRTWPSIFDGTNSPHGVPEWWKPSSEVDVVISGAGPAGLQVALSLVRQGVSFRILDKSPAPLLSGRADGVQPRFLEILHSWGLAVEVHEEGPLIERTAIYKDGKKLLFNRSHQSDSRYRGLHIITQGQLERIYIRDLLRHQILVEREKVIEGFVVESDSALTHPVCVNVKSEKTGIQETIRAKFLVGSDGANSFIRKKLQIPFDGVSTDILWGILDCIFESDYPHAWVFGSVISSKHGGCVIIPREDGYIRLYTQLDTSSTGSIAQSRQGKSLEFQEEGGRVEASSITAEEVLAQANRIFAPYKLKFAAPVSWFAVWRISERVARSFSSNDCRVHLAGDAAHVHSVMGAFGLNASIMDSANLAWKIGLCAKNLAKLSILGPSYDSERRYHTNRIIHVSGCYLRFVCNSTTPIASFSYVRPEWPPLTESVEYSPGEDLPYLESFFGTHSQFLLGVDCDYGFSPISPSRTSLAITPRNGVRAPNPRVCFSKTNCGYLYDALTGAAMIHLVLFGSNLQGSVYRHLANFARFLFSPTSFYQIFGGRARFNLVLLTKCLPHEARPLLEGNEIVSLRDNCTILYDDRAPDEDAHTCYGINHGKGAAVIVRPDLWIGTSVFLDEAEELGKYLDWLVPVK